MVAVPRLDVDDVVELVNHYAVRARAAAGNEDKGYRPLGEVLPAAGEGEALAEAVTGGATLDELHHLADEVYAVFTEAADGGDVVDVVNALVAPARPTPTLAPDGGIAWHVDDAGNALRAGLGIALLDWLHTRGPERLGVCGGNRCADAFADASPGGRKKFCSAGCLNRHKVAEHRRRAAARTAR